RVKLLFVELVHVTLCIFVVGTCITTDTPLRHYPTGVIFCLCLSETKVKIKFYGSKLHNPLEVAAKCCEDGQLCPFFVNIIMHKGVQFDQIQYPCDFYFIFIRYMYFLPFYYFVISKPFIFLFSIF
ncbi:hypothetical protein ACJX0J_013051, partial [Zea mays]